MKWDKYYLDICRTVGTKSNCLSRQIGAILVRDKSIIATGYNGPPRGVCRCNDRWMFDLKQAFVPDEYRGRPLDKICPRYIMGYRSGEGLEFCPSGHAERNALINAGREGVCIKGSNMYMDCGLPCIPCLIEIINAGVEEIVCTSTIIYGEKNKPLSDMILEQSGLKVRVYNHIN